MAAGPRELITICKLLFHTIISEPSANGTLQLCCAFIGCWLTGPLNKRLGRRGTVFVTALVSFLAVIWQAVTNSWEHLFVARFVLGLGIGPKSATVPIFAAESSPAAIRGGLVMMWQVLVEF